MAWLWTLCSYTKPSGRDVIEDWYLKQSATVRAEFDETIRDLAQRPRSGWARPTFDLLHGKPYKGLGEVRFSADRVEWRPLGFFGPHAAQFTLLIGASKKGKIWSPHDARETAARRMAYVMNDPIGASHVCPLWSDGF
jgi:hypothetical protein